MTKSHPPISKRHTASVSPFETRFHSPDCLQFLAVFCSPTAFFKHSYTSEQRPLNPLKFHKLEVVSWSRAAVATRPIRGRNIEVNAQLLSESQKWSSWRRLFSTRAQVPDALGEATAQHRDRRSLLWKPDRAHRARAPAGSLQHKDAPCTLGAMNSSREITIVRNLRFLPNVTILQSGITTCPGIRRRSQPGHASPSPEAANRHARTRRRLDNVARNAKGGLMQGLGGEH